MTVPHHAASIMIITVRPLKLTKFDEERLSIVSLELRRSRLRELRSWVACALLLTSLMTVYVLWARFHSPSLYDGSRANSTLQMVFVVSRHGNRGPITTYPVQPYPADDRTIWPYGSSQLTNSGREQLYALGQKVRSLYNGFLGDHYYEEDFKAFTTLKERCLMSAEQFLAGLFPPKGFQVWDNHLLWQPVPVYPTYLEHSDYLTDASTLCPRYQEEKDKATADFLTENKANVTAAWNFVEPYMGSTADRLMTLYNAWDFLTCAENQGLKLPAWASNVYPEILEHLVVKIFRIMTSSSDTMIRLFQGQLFQEIAGLMQAKASGSLTPDRRLYLYSGHDTTILGLLGVLGLHEAPVTDLVRTGSALVFELHRDSPSSDHHVQVLYINGNSPGLEPSLVRIPGCDYPCSLQQLMNITEKYYNITDQHKECRASIV